MSRKQLDKRVVQMINSGKFDDDWDDFDEYCEENGFNMRRVQGKPKEPKRIYPEENTDETQG